MNIAINTRFLLPHKMEGFGWYTYEISKRLVEQHPEHHFYFFFDRKYDERFVFAKNVIPVVLHPQARHPFLFYLWFEFAVAKALKKYQIDVFFSPDGYLSLQTKVPQIITIHDLNFEHYPNDVPKLAGKYLRCFFPKFAKKAQHILTVSNYSKEDIANTYQIDKTKITTIWNAASNLYKPLDSKHRIAFKQQYAQGNDYFLFVGSLHPRKNVERLLQAYVDFKTKHPEGYDLMIVGSLLWSDVKTNFHIPANFEKNIHFMGHLPLEKLVNVTASAACFTYVPYFEGFGIPLVEAMQCGVPVISGNLSSLPEVVATAALLVNPFSVEEIGKAMEQIYLDADLRKRLSQMGLERSKHFSWDKAASEVWSVLVKRSSIL